MTAILRELLDQPDLLYRHTTDEYHKMIANGIIEEGAPFELLDGQVIRKLRNAAGDDAMTIGDQHTLAVLRLGKIDRELEPLGCHMRTQQPVLLPPDDEPEPDGAIARGTIDDYHGRKPTSADLLCVIEMSDASLKRDRGYKLELYANHRIPMYVIVNLVDRAVEVHRNPLPGQGRFKDVAELKAGQQVEFPTARGTPLSVAVEKLLP
jgi:Uma2 family endonuclease